MMSAGDSVTGRTIEQENREFLFDVLRCFVKSLPGDTIAKPSAWDHHLLNRCISEHYLGPIFDYVLSDRQVPEQLTRSWKRDQQAAYVRNTQAADAAVQLFTIFSAANIQAAVMRGLSMAYTYYPQPYLRPMVDVDVLVKKDDYARVEKALSLHGHKPVMRLRSQLVYRLNRTMIEVHRSLLTPTRYRWLTDGQMLLGSLRTVELCRGHITCLSLENELWGSLIHSFTHHGLTRMISLVDIALLARQPSLDWTQLVRLCKQTRLSRMCHFTLDFANHLLHLNLQEKLSLFDPHACSSRRRFFPAYENQFFNVAGLSDYLNCKRNLFYVAQHPIVKFRQALRLFNLNELRQFARALRCSLGTSKKAQQV